MESLFRWNFETIESVFSFSIVSKFHRKRDSIDHQIHAIRIEFLQLLKMCSSRSFLNGCMYGSEDVEVALDFGRYVSVFDFCLFVHGHYYLSTTGQPTLHTMAPKRRRRASRRRSAKRRSAKRRSSKRRSSRRRRSSRKTTKRRKSRRRRRKSKKGDDDE